MGNAESTPSTSWLHERYAFVDHLSAGQLGTVAVFKKKQENYDYLALVKRAVRRDYLNEIQRELCFLTGKHASLPFLKIMQVQVGQLDLQDSLLAQQPPSRSVCFQQESEEGINIYMELLTFTLQDHLAYKRGTKYEITLKEYSYILKTVMAAAMLYQEWQLQYLTLDLSSHSIFLKPNGEIKLLPFKSQFLRESQGCGECLPKCSANGVGSREYRTYSFSIPNKKEGKYLKQLKNLSLQLFATINQKVDPYVRTIPNFNSRFLLSLQELEAIKQIQYAIVSAQSLQQIYQILRDVQDDFLQVQQENNIEVEVNNPETYQAFMQHLSARSSSQKSEERPMAHSKHQHVTRNIFGVEPTGESDSNTHSNMSPRSQRRPSFKHFLDAQPSVSVLPQFHFQ